MASSRLPRKVLLPIVGKPMLALQIERIRQSRLIDRIIVATSESPLDDPIESLARELGVECFRGSEVDVLGRVVAALRAFQVETHVEFHGDSPMPDALLVDSIVGFYLKHSAQYDFVSNALTTTYPAGAEVAVYPASVLFDAERQADPDLREHVSLHIYRRPDRFRLCNLEAPLWLHAPDVYLEVDTPVDFEVVSAVFEHFYPQNPGFTLSEAIRFCHSRGLDTLNRDVERRWKALLPETSDAV